MYRNVCGFPWAGMDSLSTCTEADSPHLSVLGFQPRPGLRKRRRPGRTQLNGHWGDLPAVLFYGGGPSWSAFHLGLLGHPDFYSTFRLPRNSRNESAFPDQQLPPGWAMRPNQYSVSLLAPQLEAFSGSPGCFRCYLCWGHGQVGKFLEERNPCRCSRAELWHGSGVHWGWRHSQAQISNVSRAQTGKVQSRRLLG